MNIISDKIFVTVFTAFIAVVTTASVVVAHRPEDSLLEGPVVELVTSGTDALKHKPFEVVSAEDLLGDGPLSESAPTADVIKHDVEVVVGEPVKQAEPFVVLNAADLEKVLEKAIAAGTAAGIKAGLAPKPAPIVPMWKKILSWTWFGVKLPYQVLMFVPVEVRALTMLYFILKFKPELFGIGIKEVIKRSPGLAKFLFTEIGIPVAQEMSNIIVDGVTANVAEFIPVGVMGGIANASATSAQAVAGLANAWMPEWIQNVALSLGY